MAATISLVAGILLTSAGLLALLPFVLRFGRKDVPAANPLEGALMPAFAAADAFMHPEDHFEASVHYRNDRVNEEVEELMAHLFSLRMTVSELTAEVQAVEEVLATDIFDGADASEASDAAEDPETQAPSENVA